MSEKDRAMAARWAKVLGIGAVVVAAGAVAAWALTKPQPHEASYWASVGQPDLAKGEQLFWAGGCAGCHAAEGAEGDAAKIMSGGLALKSPFGTFHVPNISPDPEAGIGSWTLAQFGDAMTRGVGPNGEHLYPSFPYGSYARLSAADVNDLYGYMKTLPPSSNVAPPHELGFPFNQRLAVGGWKLLYFDDGPRVELASADDKVKRGQFLVEGPGHCGECHTPRNALGGFEKGQWLAGGPNPEGQGTIPNITPGSKDIGGWSEDEITEYLSTGFTPDFDSVGGSMVEVQKNIAHLPKSDLQAIAAYLKAVPAR
jgi:mono/diheme cytochrome c family protein